MKTHSGSFFGDVLDRAGTLLGAWFIALCVALAWWRATNGELKWFLIDGAFAVWMTIAWLRGYRRMLDHVARVAVLDERIAVLRRENKALETAAGGR